MGKKHESEKASSTNEQTIVSHQEGEIDKKNLIRANQDFELQNAANEKKLALLSSANEKLISEGIEKSARILELEFGEKKTKKTRYEIQKLNKKLTYSLIKRTTQYSFLSQINQSIVHTDNERSLFRKSCYVAYYVGKFKIAWIGLFDRTDTKINLIAQKGIEEDDLVLLLNGSKKIDSMQNHILTTGEHFICNTISSEISDDNWKLIAERDHINSFMILPLKKGGRIIGTFNLYSSETGFFDKEEVALLTEIVNDISFALDFFEKEKIQKTTEDLLLKNEKRFRALVENGTDGVAILTVVGKLLYISSSIQLILGYSEAEAMNINMYELIHDKDKQSIAALWSQILQTQAISTELHKVRMRHRNGSWIWLEATIKNMLHDSVINGVVYNFRDVTQTVTATENRDFDKNNLNALINTTKDLMWSVDKDLKLITFNNPFFDTMKTRWNKEVVEGDYVLQETLSKKEKVRLKLQYSRAFSGEEFTELKCTTSPVESWAQISHYPIRSGNEIIGSACYSRDVTNLKKTEQLLDKSEIFNRGILNALNSHIAVVDKSGKIIAVNEAWTRYSTINGGILSKTGIGNDYFKECKRAAKEGIESASIVLSGMKNVLKNKKKDFYLEYPSHSPTEKCWFATTITKFGNQEQQIVVTHSNISQQKFAEENLLSSKEKLDEAQSLAHVGSWQLDFKENTFNLSDEGCRILEICRDENNITVDKWVALLHPDDLDVVLAKIAESRTLLKDINYYYRIISTDGQVRYIYCESKIIFDVKNSAIGQYGIIQDVTARQIAEEEREKISSDIVRRNQDLEQFSYMVSHNLRAPVANILGLSEIISDGYLEPEIQKEIVSGISDSVKKLDGVITDLNHILEQKQSVIQNKEIVDFTELTLDIKYSIDKLIQKERVSLRLNFEKIPAIFTIKSYMHSIFYNLIHNSIKYRRLGCSPIIDISSSFENNEILLVFKDNGMGMNVENLGAKIFGMYKRFHPEISDGKGIGLYMVKTQVQSLGGTISVLSEVNRGTEFTIRFPV
jgi:PAS domain S-box-containing protein